MDESQALQQVHAVYQETQVLRLEDEQVKASELSSLAGNWQDDGIPSLQRKVAETQLENLRNGVVDPVFASLHAALQYVELPAFSLLDLACASGYYSEVISRLDSRRIHYFGADYSAAMIELARECYPEIEFKVADATRLEDNDSSFDVLMLSGVLEHVPEFELAIASACRVASRYIVVHRCPLGAGAEHVYSRGSQYNIVTPRIRFSKSMLTQSFRDCGFELCGSVDVYAKPKPHRRRSWTSRLRSRLKQVVARKPAEAPSASVESLVFRAA